MHRALPLLLLAAVACTAGDPPRPAPTSTASDAPGVVVAVERRAGAVELYRVGADRKAVLVGRLTPPAGAVSALMLTLSGGPRPDACVVWADARGEPSELRCHAFGDPTGVRVPGPPDTSVALRADGRALAWTARAGEHGQDLVTATYAAGVVTDERARPTYRDDGSHPDFGCGDRVVGLAWSTDRRLVLECVGANDYPGGLVAQDLDASGLGREVEDTAQPPYNYLSAPRGADATTVLAVQGEYCEIECADGKPRAAPRAVRASLTTGRVVDVVATPAAGRAVHSVSGGAGGVVYVTVGDGGDADVRVYLRLPGERRGVRVTGLPTDLADDVVAQP